MKKLLAVWVWLLIVALVLTVLGGWWFMSAMTTAHLRFGECGPTSLEHVDSDCRVAARLLYQAYATLAAALAFLVAGLYLRHRHRHAT